MIKLKNDNNGMTLVELLLSFTILGILMIVAAKIIHSSTEVYYYNKTTSYGSQAAQIVATELRGELESALPLSLVNSSSYIHITNTSSVNSIEFIAKDGQQIKYELLPVEGSDHYKLKKSYFSAYNLNTMELFSTASEDAYAEDVGNGYSSTNIGMGYEVKSISFTEFPDYLSSKGISYTGVIKYPVLVMEITVGNNHFGEYSCTELIPLYSFYGINSSTKNIYDFIG